MKERYNIKITDIQLTILSDEPEDFVYATVNQLDERIRNLAVQNKRCSKLDAALLCALDSLGEKIKDEKKIRNLEHQIELYEATNKRLREELEHLRSGKDISAPVCPESHPTAEESVAASPNVILPSSSAPLESEVPTAPVKAEAETAAAKEQEADIALNEAEADTAGDTPATTIPREEKTESTPEGAASLHDVKLRQIEELLRRRSEENSARQANTDDVPAAPAGESHTATVGRDEKLRQIEDLLRKNGGNKSLSEALHDAIGN